MQRSAEQYTTVGAAVLTQGRCLVSGDLLLVDVVMLGADLLQRKAQHRQSPLTDHHLLQRTESVQRDHSSTITWKLAEFSIAQGFIQATTTYEGECRH